MTIRFSEATGGIAGIAGTDGLHDFIGPSTAEPLLWRLIFRDAGGTETIVDNACGVAPEITRTEGRTALRWSGVSLAAQTGVVDVRVLCEETDHPGTVHLHLWVDNRSDTFGLWNVQFPVIAPMSQPGACDIAKGHGNWGELHVAASETLKGEYPSYNMPMQFMVVQQQGDALYLAAHDPGAWPKDFFVEPGGEFRIETWAAGMGVPGSGWSDPFPIAIGVARGDWMSGCKQYRAWAVQEAPWTRKGPLTGRSDVPDAMKQVCAWVLTDGAREKAVPPVREFARRAGAPVGTHWYNWHAIPFDTDYPAYFPTKPGFADGVAELKSDGIVVMPYINARLWDIANRDFPAARPYATRDENGEVTIEDYGSGARLAVMCPTQAHWQEVVGEIIRRLADECGVSAVYMDQIASARPRTCFDPSHGHAIGSGAWWVDGYREMLDPVKSWCVSREHPVGLTSENNAEPYMDNVDSFLLWTQRDSNEVPLMTAVYGGYTLYFASSRAFGHGPEAYCLCQARDFTWGTQLGWEGAEGLLDPDHAAELDCLVHLARLRAALLDYLVYGEMLQVLRSETDLPAITGTWNTWKGDRPVTLPAVHGALWRGTDGSVAAIFANADTEARTFTFAFDADCCGAGDGVRWDITRVTASAEAPVDAPTGRTFTLDVQVPARDGVAVRIRPAAS